MGVQKSSAAEKRRISAFAGEGRRNTRAYFYVWQSGKTEKWAGLPCGALEPAYIAYERLYLTKPA